MRCSRQNSSTEYASGIVRPHDGATPSSAKMALPHGHGVAISSSDGKYRGDGGAVYKSKHIEYVNRFCISQIILTYSFFVYSFSSALSRFVSGGNSTETTGSLRVSDARHVFDGSSTGLPSFR